MSAGWTVYKHTFPNGKIYIGITGNNPERRWSEGHGYLGKVEGKYNQPLIAHAIVKYGWSNILHEIIADNLSEKAARKMENDLIVKYHSNDNNFGYNSTTIDDFSEAMKQHIENVSIKTICDQTGVIYSSIRKASKDTGVCASSIRKSCQDGSIYKGLSFSRVCDEILDEDFE